MHLSSILLKLLDYSIIANVDYQLQIVTWRDPIPSCTAGQAAFEETCSSGKKLR